MDHPHETTIVGLSTPPGVGGVAVVRVSGILCRAVFAEIFAPESKKNTGLPFRPEARKQHLGWIEDEGKKVDEVLLCFFPGPRSYTGEDVLEINCHGGHWVTEKIIGLILKRGAELAAPGEFTRRAFLNGKMDLTRAEAVHDIIHARSPLMAEISANNLKGALFERIDGLKKILVANLALINAEIDFADENQSFVVPEKFKGEMEGALGEMNHLRDNASKGIYLSEGYAVALTGRPNAGKSSIMNALLNRERSIVTEIPGTTRDVVEDRFLAGGLPVRLMDTAGVRETEDMIEREGIRRAEKARSEADLILWVIDLSRPAFEDYETIVDSGKPMLAVLNKSDLAQSSGNPLPEATPRIEICAKNGGDVGRLKDKIREIALGGETPPPESCLITNMRQKRCVERAATAMENLLNSLSAGRAEEVLGHEIAEALNILGEVAGETTPDDLLDHVFQNFCIGK